MGGNNFLDEHVHALCTWHRKWCYCLRWYSHAAVLNGRGRPAVWRVWVRLGHNKHPQKSSHQVWAGALKTTISIFSGGKWRLKDIGSDCRDYLSILGCSFLWVSHHLRCRLLCMSSSSSLSTTACEDLSSHPLVLSSSIVGIYFLGFQKAFCSSSWGRWTKAKVESSWRVRWTCRTNVDTSRKAEGLIHNRF